MAAAAMSPRNPVNQLLDLALPSTSAEPVLAPMSPPSPRMASMAVPCVAVSRIICFSWAAVLARRPSARASCRPSSSGDTR